MRMFYLTTLRLLQHDVPETQLKAALDGVVEECVSFVGVDLNVGGEALLK